MHVWAITVSAPPMIPLGPSSYRYGAGDGILRHLAIHSDTTGALSANQYGGSFDPDD